jgi:hypothetical protein
VLRALRVVDITAGRIEKKWGPYRRSHAVNGSLVARGRVRNWESRCLETKGIDGSSQNIRGVEGLTFNVYR